MPPFGAVSVTHRGQPLAIVRVADSNDTPHVAGGVAYQRTHGGKQRITEARDVIALARRGEEARHEAEQVRLYGLPLISYAMATPQYISGDAVNRYGDSINPEESLPPLLEWIVRASPYTVSGAFADRALSKGAADLAERTVRSLFPEPHEGRGIPAAFVEPRARGLYCLGRQMTSRSHVDLGFDAGGTVAVRSAARREYSVLAAQEFANRLAALIDAAATVLRELDGHGRAAFGLEVRGATKLKVQWGSGAVGQLGRAEAPLVDGHRLELGGDLAVPAGEDDVNELAQRWVCELARAAGLPLWEPSPEAGTLAGDEPD
jgi:hypothetical protein